MKINLHIPYRPFIFSDFSKKAENPKTYKNFIKQIFAIEPIIFFQKSVSKILISYTKTLTLYSSKTFKSFSQLNNL